ncbi:DNA mismatch repair protein MutT [Paenibacillus montaniterrae]|uniref:DNA mismatch repair protein MutT n=1 Tax=Paenibacillus montaniterrae TaxID=429341 RepID=A0A919YPY8_9BACL|nr:NUDIX hydrolase [Paenibacillus montaniterrae]GIP17535.1 DNA mismatch repair protein MutT [Paenibacillus montaniterrae]
MNKWTGCAAVCMNELHELLMVRARGIDGWLVPSGSLEVNETTEECCIRETREETGYEVEIVKQLYLKQKTTSTGIEIRTFYYEVKLVGGKVNIDDPDKDIYSVAWFSIDELNKITYAYEEDKDFLIEHVKKNQ